MDLMAATVVTKKIAQKQTGSSAKLWSRRFEHEPEKATGVILRAVAKSDIKRF